MGSMIGAIMFVSGMVAMTMRSALAKKELHSILMKIILSEVQFNSLAASLEFEWPESVKGLMKVQQDVANIGNSIVSVDCFLDIKTTTSPFFLKALWFMFVPLVLIAFPFVFYIPYFFYLIFKAHDNTARKKVFGQVVDLYVTTIVVALFMIHMNITQVSFQMFQCKRLG
eukprot:690713_1